eukprot:3938810-Amphidinium_carterae.1
MPSMAPRNDTQSGKTSWESFSLSCQSVEDLLSLAGEVQSFEPLLLCTTSSTPLILEEVQCRKLLQRLDFEAERPDTKTVNHTSSAITVD